MRQLITVDFETEAIQSRPEYPPRPVGVAIKFPGKAAKYHAWGHPEGNNTTKETTRLALKRIWSSGQEILFHNAKFDLDVAEVHMGLKLPPWDRIHDTLYTLFLLDPHAPSLSLKPSAEHYLKMPPEERDRVAEWLIKNGVIAKNQNAGPHIAKAPVSVVGPYACGDVDRTLALHNLLHPRLDAKMRVAYDRERRLMPILLRSERAGLLLDVDHLSEDLILYEGTMQWVEDWLRRRLKAPNLNFDAAADVAEALERAGVVSEWVLTKTGRKSTAKDNLGPERFNDREVAYALGWRTRCGTVMKNSMRPWLEQAGAGNRIYTEINQVRQTHGNDSKGTRTGRLSASRFMNVTKNFLNKGDGYQPPDSLGLPPLPLVRHYVLPDLGHAWNQRDWRQQEFRVTAHYEDGPLAECYRRDPVFDVHDMVRGYIRELGDEDLANVDRVIIKNFNHGVLYGEGKDTLARKTRMAPEKAARLKAMIWRAMPGVYALNEYLKDRGRRGEPIRTWGGRLYYCEKPSYSEKFGRDMTWEYKLLDYLAQGSAADMCKEAMIRYDEVRHKEARMYLPIHDEINNGAPPKLLDAEDARLRKVMEGMEFDVPMTTDRKRGELDRPWGALKKVV